MSQVKIDIPSITVVINFREGEKPVYARFENQTNVPAVGDLVTLNYGRQYFQGFVKTRHWQYSEDGPFVDIFVESEAPND